MLIKGKKEYYLVIKNISISLVIFSPLFLFSWLSLYSNKAEGYLYLIAPLTIFLICYILISDYIEFNKSPETLTLDLKKGCLYENEIIKIEKFKKVYFIGFGNKTKSYRLLIVKTDNSEELKNRHYIFDKSLEEIRSEIKNSNINNIKVINGYQFFNMKIFNIKH